jgi:hypothetical protein
MPDELSPPFRSAIDAADITARLTYNLGGIEAMSGQTTGAIYLVAVATLFDVFSFLARRWADDPPRYDFESRTRARRPTIRSEAAYPVSDAAGVIAADLAHDLDESNRTLSAGLRAYERMQGALRRQAPVAGLRAEEARRLSQEGGVAIQAAGATFGLATGLRVKSCIGAGVCPERLPAPLARSDRGSSYLSLSPVGRAAQRARLIMLEARVAPPNDAGEELASRA